MLRQLLTLLAVISGFTLAAEPVRAAQADVVSTSQAVQDVDCEAISMLPLQLVKGTSARAKASSPCRQRDLVIWVPTVQLQVDRARE